MKFVVCLLVLVGAASAHYNCRSPQVFESSISEFLPKFKLAIPFGRLTFDGENRRQRIIEEVITNNTDKNYFDIIYFQRYKVLFTFNIVTKNCTRTKVDLPWKPLDIPDDAQYIGDAYVGSAGIPLGGLLVQSWIGNSTEYGGFFYIGSYTHHGCLPISFYMNGPKIGHTIASFYNIVLGISDPNVFIPPKECFQQGQVLPEDLEYIYQEVNPRHLRKFESLYKLIRQRENL